jgi:hypothetical protein
MLNLSSRLPDLRADRLEVPRERQRRSRLAVSSLLETYRFRIVGREQKLSVVTSPVLDDIWLLPVASQEKDGSGCSLRLGTLAGTPRASA